MRKRFSYLFIIVFVSILIIDLYVFSFIFGIIRSVNHYVFRLILTIIYWLIPVFFAISFSATINRFLNSRNPSLYSLLFRLVGLFILVYIPKIVLSFFLLLQDVITSIYIVVISIANLENPFTYQGFRDSIFNFISEGALFISAFIFMIVLYGLTLGRFIFKTCRINLSFKSLPDAFNGFRIIQISDLHTGSLNGLQHKIMKAIRLINKEKPDLIVFTGDMVNDFAEEMDGWETVIGELQSVYGKFSILGNHDYGEYYPWNNQQEKLENIEKIIEKERKMGFRVLLNESEIIEKDGHKIAILGVENWGLPPFKQYGNLQKALWGVPDDCFKILLTHDPSHWDMEVVGKTNISLTLSGHTHGFQFGIRAGRLRWSPVKFKYARWEGLHTLGDQFLNVNTGLGYIGFPGRIGIRPEIAVIELRKS